MPALPLNPEQQQDANRLKIEFTKWQEGQRGKKQPWSQDHASEALQFGQSALSQYLNGRIPLNVDAAAKMSNLLGVRVEVFSPSIAREIAALNSGITGANPVDAPAVSPDLDYSPPALSYIDSNSGSFNAIRIPLMQASASMGDGEDQSHEDVVVGALHLAPEWVRQIRKLTAASNLRFIHGYGDSMEPTYSAGDILLVDTGVKEARIDGVYVLEAQKRLFIKRVTQDMDGRYEITSDNPKVKTVSLLDGHAAINVLGRVVYAWNGKSL